MTVRELREILAQFDENLEVQIIDDNWNEAIDEVDEYNGIVIIRSNF